MFSILLSISLAISSKDVDVDRVTLESGVISLKTDPEIEFEEISKRADAVKEYVEGTLCYKVTYASRCSYNSKSQTLPAPGEWIYFKNCVGSKPDRTFVFVKSDTSMNLSAVMDVNFKKVCDIGGVKAYMKKQ